MRDIMRFRVLAMVLLALSLFAGSFSAAGAQDTTDGATPPPAEEPGSLVISKFVCTQIEEPTATISDPIGAAEGVPDEGCVADSADFQIFINGDFTSDPINVFVDGTATVDGLPSTEGGEPNALFEPAFNVFFNFDIAPGAVTTITVLNPADDGDGATPVPGADDKKDGDDGTADGGTDDKKDGDDGTADGGTDDKKDGDDGAVDGVADDGTDDAAADDGTEDAASDDGEPVAGEQEEADEVAGEEEEGGVSALPSTGQGSSGGANGSAIVLLFGAMSMVALAGGFAWRQRRSA